MSEHDVDQERAKDVHWDTEIHDHASLAQQAVVDAAIPSAYYAAQREAAGKMQAAEQARWADERAAERREREETFLFSRRAAAMEAAVRLGCAPDADGLVRNAAKIEAFLKGEAPQGS